MKNDGTYEGAYSQRADAYSGYSQAEIDEEIAAQYFGVVFSSESNIRRVIENSSQQELSMWKKIVEHLKDFVKRIKDAIERYAVEDKTVRAALKADADTVEELARQFDVCLKEAAKNKKPAEQVQGGEKKSLDIKQVTLVTTGLTNEQQKILDHYGIKNLNDAAQVQINVFDTLQQNGFFTNDNNTSRIDVNEASGMVIETNRSGINETFNYNNFCRNSKNIKILKLSAVPLLPTIIKNASVIEDNVQNSKNKKSSAKYAYLLYTTVIDGVELDIKITVRKSPRKNKFWVHHIYIKNDTAVASGEHKNSESPALQTNGVEVSVSQNAHAVNTNDTQNSSKDTDKASKHISKSNQTDTDYIDRMSLKDYNNRGWAYSLLNKEDIRLFYEKVSETMRPNSKTTVKKLADGTKIFDVNNKILFVGGTFKNPIIEFAVAINADNANDSEYIKENILGDAEYDRRTKERLASWLSFTSDSYGEEYIRFYNRKDFIATSETEKGNIKRATLPDGFASFGYTRESYRRSGSNQNDNGEVSGDSKYSKQITQQTEDNIEQLALENEALRELLDSARDVEAELRNRLDVAKKMNRTTRGLIPDKTELFRIVRKYNHSKSGYTNTELVKYIDGIMWDLRNNQGDSNTLMNSLTALMQDLLETSESVNRDLYEQYAEFRKFFRGSTLYVNQKVYDFLLEEYGSKKNLRNATLGKLNIKPMTETDSGTTLTQAYQDIVQHFPELLNPDVDEYHKKSFRRYRIYPRKL